MNTSEQLLAMALNRDLVPAASRTEAGPQCGFIQGRRIEDDMLGLDGCFPTYSIYATSRATALLLGLANAFPSLPHAWLFVALIAMNIPTRLLKLIRVLYNNLMTQLDYARRTVKARKCAVIPSLVPPYSAVRDLVDSIRSFAGVAITASARYLGVDIGPGSSDTRWLSVIDKIMRRAGATSDPPWQLC